MFSREFDYVHLYCVTWAAVLDFCLLFNTLLVIPLLLQDAIPSAVVTCVGAFPSSSNLF